jgi:membrane-associated phospholipid phosphatase
LAIVGWCAFLIAGTIFLVVAWNVLDRTALVVVDAKLAAWLHAHASPGLTRFFLAVTHVNSTVGVSVLGFLFALVLARMREWYWVLTLVSALAGGLALNVLLKLAYQRARPVFDEPLVELATYSFPSGHTAGAVLFYGVLAAFLVSRFYDRRKRAACVVAAVIAVVLVAFSRMYLGAHYLSDVLAAACSSTAWLVLCLSVVHHLVRRRMRR